MLRRVIAIFLIFVCASLGWLFLSASISARTSGSDSKLRPDIASMWGAPQEQAQPTGVLTAANAPGVVQTGESPVVLATESSRVDAKLTLEQRKKGLLWYSVYSVDFVGDYVFRNPDPEPHWLTFRFAFPAKQAVYDGLAVSLDGNPIPFKADKEGLSACALLPPGRSSVFETRYRSFGLGSWLYRLGNDVTETRNFRLSMHTNFDAIDFPADTLSPKQERRSGAGWDLLWDYSDLISGFQIGMRMPEKLQPGPLVGDICLFAPVSLLLFFFVIFVVTTLRRIDLHPMHYFFLASAFFAFHLLLAYLADQIQIQWAFVLASLVSVGLVISYLRIVAGPRFALVEAAGAQTVYLVLFSSTFFLKGFTGLTIALGSILTLFICMQLTARLNWTQLWAHQAHPVPAIGPRG